MDIPEMASECFTTRSLVTFIYFHVFISVDPLAGSFDFTTFPFNVVSQGPDPPSSTKEVLLLSVLHIVWASI